MEDSCHYELHAKNAKDQMLHEIRQLQRKNEDLEEQHSALAEEHALVEQIIKSFKNDGQRPELINRLKRGESLPSIATWLGSVHPSICLRIFYLQKSCAKCQRGNQIANSGTIVRRPVIDGVESLSPDSEANLDTAIERYHKDLVNTSDPRYWTSSTDDPALIEHLVMLYLTWFHPFHVGDCGAPQVAAWIKGPLKKLFLENRVFFPPIYCLCRAKETADLYPG